MNKLDSQQPEHAIEYDTCLQDVILLNVPENSYLHLKDINGIYYIFQVTAKAGDFIYVECVFGPNGIANKRGLVKDRFLMRYRKVDIDFEKGDMMRYPRSIDPLKEIIVSKQKTPFLPDRPIVYNNPIPSFDASMLPPHSIAIEVDTKSGKQYNLKILAIDEQGNIHVSVEGNGSCNGVVGRLKSSIIGEGYRISIKDTRTKRTVHTSYVRSMQFKPLLKGRVEAILELQYKNGEIGPFNQ